MRFIASVPLLLLQHHTEEVPRPKIPTQFEDQLGVRRQFKSKCPAGGRLKQPDIHCYKESTVCFEKYYVKPLMTTNTTDDLPQKPHPILLNRRYAFILPTNPFPVPQKNPLLSSRHIQSRKPHNLLPTANACPEIVHCEAHSALLTNT